MATQYVHDLLDRYEREQARAKALHGKLHARMPILRAVATLEELDAERAIEAAICTEIDEAMAAVRVTYEELRAIETRMN